MRAVDEAEFRDYVSGHLVQLRVSTLRVDGTSVYLACNDYGQNSVAPGKNPPAPKRQRSSTPLTEQQLIDVALDPRLAFYP